MQQLLTLFKKLIPMSEQQTLEEIKRTTLPIYGVKNVLVTDDYIICLNPHSNTCLVSHCDTVGKDGVIPMQLGDTIVNANGGVLGADDRAGVAMILHLIKMAENMPYTLPNAIFTTQEERGGIGVRKLCNEISEGVFSHIDLFIELDRRGCDDYVDYSWGNPDEVNDYFESFGYKSSWGSYSDVDILTQTYGIPHGNLSCGYYNEHTTKEYLSIPDYKLCLERCIKILENPIDKRYEVASSYKGYDDYKFYDDDYSYKKESYLYEEIDDTEVSYLISMYSDSISVEEILATVEDKNLGCTYTRIRITDPSGSKIIREYEHIDGQRYRVELPEDNQVICDKSDELLWEKI